MERDRATEMKRSNERTSERAKSEGTHERDEGEARRQRPVERETVHGARCGRGRESGKRADASERASVHPRLICCAVTALYLRRWDVAVARIVILYCTVCCPGVPRRSAVCARPTACPNSRHRHRRRNVRQDGTDGRTDGWTHSLSLSLSLLPRHAIRPCSAFTGVTLAAGDRPPLTRSTRNSALPTCRGAEHSRTLAFAVSIRWRSEVDRQTDRQREREREGLPPGVRRIDSLRSAREEPD